MGKLPTMAAHTAAKHAILTRYLGAWFPILGRHNKRINYIDGFAGSGEYEGGEPGSPILALRIATAHFNKGTLAPNVDVNFAFVESDLEHAEHLRAYVQRMKLPSSFHVEILPGAFRDVVGELLTSLERGQKSLAPTLAFVDPFGFSGIPFDLMRRILAHPRCEVFVNVMVDFINRFLEHPNEAVTSHFAETFGTNQVLNVAQQAGDRKSALLNLYRSQLIGAAKYVGRFDMRNDRHNMLYSLFFASNEALGFVKMKEAMWSVDKHQGTSFSDADPSGFYNFSLFGWEPLRQLVLERFQGQRVAMVALEKFVVEETDYLPKHLRSILADEERGARVIVESVPGYRRPRFTYKSDKIWVVFP